MSGTENILRSWQANAQNWIDTIDANEIESRNLVTNAAIVDLVLKYKPFGILDIGCGEGWLTRNLRAKGFRSHGIDAVASLVNNAIEKDGEHYTVCSYEDLVNNKFPGISDFNAAVINFALLDQEETENLVHFLGQALPESALVFVQTLHPASIAAEEPYRSGWKEGSWKGLKRDFVLPYKWYFRTMGDWVRLFRAGGLDLLELVEPLHPLTAKPASVIFVMAVKNRL
jgi:hypothetical protein